MQKSDVEVPIQSRWIRRGEILRDGPRLEALTVDSNAPWQVIEADRLWLSIAQDTCVAR
jgi:hypothetical protein